MISLRKDNTNTTYGYGIIEWNQNSKVINGLVVYGYVFHLSSNVYSPRLLPVNNCLPF